MEKQSSYTKFVYDGVVYNSLHSLCKTLNLSYGSVYQRLRNGMSLEEALSKQNYSSYRVTYMGVVYRSVKSLCKTLNLSYNCVKKRLQMGMSLEEALSQQDYRGNQVTYMGVAYNSVRSLCKALNLSYPCVSKRLQKGMSLEDAISYDRAFKVDGKVYSSLNKALKENRISPPSVYETVDRYNVSFEEAFTICLFRNLNREYDNVMSFTVEDGLLNCSCSKCNQHMVLTPQLALDHLRSHIKES